MTSTEKSWRVVIAEDERDQREALVRLLETHWPEAELVAVCADGREALAALQNHKPNVLMTDIRMPGVTGLELASEASGKAEVVLITAYQDHAVEAFETGALDYLLKPVTAERFNQTVNRLRSRLDTGTPSDLSRALAELEKRLAGAEPQWLKWITASIGDSVRLVAVEEVMFFQASDKYVRVVTADDEAVIRMSLKQLEECLDPNQFWRIHRSSIVAVTAIDRVDKDELGRWWLRLKNHPEKLPVSEGERARFRGM
ncbi:MAG: response regulator transcription factor [Wenzhouxiangella sp.]|nr:response regulator transcription factor [Wenzhouxiangella sp.]MCH8477787.1 LytTR family DNA-binding domain-containing protein [Wenzhouxiangella sp.]TVR92166.1 MAG: DNA-binding response regulator [Wenzhouxiangellaceae bacterium]